MWRCGRVFNTHTQSFLLPHNTYSYTGCPFSLQDILGQGVVNLTPLCFHDLALLPGEKPPDPTVPVPKEASVNEVQNSVEIRLENMKKAEVNDTRTENT